MKSGWKIALSLVLMFAFVVACSQKKDTAEVQQSAPAAQEQVVQEQENEEQETEQASEENAETEEVAAEADDEGQIVEISGTLVQTDEGVGLFSDSGNYLLDQDLSEMVGQNVRVTGTLNDQEGKPVFSVSSISIIE